MGFVERKETYVVAGLGLPKLDSLRGKSLDVASLVDDTSTSGSSTDVNADEVVLLQMVSLGNFPGWLLPDSS